MHIYRSLIVLSAILAACLPNAAQAKSKKIVFVAGPKDHGGRGSHEYQKDLATLQYCLEHSNIRNIETKLYVGQVPKDLNEIKDASVIVLESSGDRVPRETHSLFPQTANTDGKSYPPDAAARLQEFDKLMKKGVGLVVLHYATIIDNQTARGYFLDWLGGYFAQESSKVTLTEWNVDLKSPSHPVLNGVKPWTNFREEFFTMLHLPDDPRRTPLLAAETVQKTPNRRLPALGDPPEIVSFVVQRKGGGRGFVMTGVHSHANLANEDNRRVLLNGIVWAAKIKVPAAGVVSTLPDDFGK